MLTVFLLNFIVAGPAFAAAPDSPSGTTYKIDANASYFTTTTNYAPGGGVTEDLPNGGSFTDINTTVTYTQDLDRVRRLYGGIVYSATESSDGRVDRTNGGFNEILAGGQYWVKSWGYKFGPSADFVYPLVRVDRGTDDVLLGEGAMKLRLGSWMNWTFGSWTPFAFAGYEYRDEGRSHAVPYNLGIKFRGATFYAQAEYRGFERLFSNADTENRASRDVFLQRVNGGSYRFYSINPSGSEFAGEVGYSIGPVTAYLGGAIVVNGSSYADGITVMGGVSFSPKSSSTNAGGPVDEFDRINSPAGGSDDDRFTPHVDPFDEFDPTKPPQPEPKKPPRKPRAPKPAPEPEMPEEDSSLMEEPLVPPAAPAPAPAPKAAPARPDAKSLGIDDAPVDSGPEVQLRPARPKTPAPKSATKPRAAPRGAPKPAPPRAAPAPRPAPVKSVPSRVVKPPPKPAAKPAPARPPKPRPKPQPKKNKVDKMLEESEESLKNL